MRICFVSREYEGYAGAGGLKDVVRALAEALAENGHEVRVFLPGYAFVGNGEIVGELALETGNRGTTARIHRLSGSPIEILAVETPAYRQKLDVYTYTEDDAPPGMNPGEGHRDALLLNAELQESVVRFLASEPSPPDLIHCHDAHTAMLGLYLRHIAPVFFRSCALMTTIHNAGLAYQQIPGTIDSTMLLTGLPKTLLQDASDNGLVIPFLAAGLSGPLTTVSPGYARDILSGRDEFSGTLGPSLRKRGIRLHGIYNGLDAERWKNQARRLIDEKLLPGTGKSGIRKKLVSQLASGTVGQVSVIGGLPDPSVHWILFHGRITYQKGLDELLTLSGSRHLKNIPCHFLVYGQGEKQLEESLTYLAKNRKNWSFLNGYNPELTAPLIAASSWIVVPSRWEPCGQIDMIGQLLGALPVVRRVGGLKKVRNRLDGLSYSPERQGGLEKKLLLALNWEINRPGKVRGMRQRAENIIYERRSWRKILVRGYLPLYRKAIRQRQRSKT